MRKITILTVQRLTILVVATLFLLSCQSTPETVTIEPPAPTAANELTAENAQNLGLWQRWGKGEAEAIQLSANGRLLAVASTVGVYVYDSAAAMTEVGFTPTQQPASNLTFSPDGRFLGYFDSSRSQYVVWEPATGQQVAQLPLATPLVYLARFLPDGESLLISTPQETAVWSTTSPTDRQTLLKPTTGALGPTALSADLRWLLVSELGNESSELRLFDLADLALVHTLTVPDQLAVKQVRFSPDTLSVAAMAAPRTDTFATEFLVWARETAVLTNRLAYPMSQSVEAWQFSAESDGLLLGTRAGTIERWRLNETAVTETIPTGSDAIVMDVRLVPQSSQLLLTQLESQVRLLDMASGNSQLLTSDRGSVHQLLLGDDQESVVVLTLEGMIVQASIAQGDETAVFADHALGSINSVAFSPDASLVTVGTSEGNVRLQQTANGETVRSWNSELGNVDSVAISPDGSLLVEGIAERVGPVAFDDTVSVWNLADGSLAHRLAGEKENVAGCSFFRNSVRFSPDGTLIAATSHDFTAHLWDAATGERLHIFEPHVNTLLDVAFGPNGRLLATASEDGTIRLWDLDGYERVRTIQSPIGGFWSVAFSPDGRFLAAGNLTGAVTLYDVATGELVRTMAGEKNRISNIAFSPNGRLLAAGGEGNSVLVWSVEDGQLRQTLTGHSNVVLTVAFSPDSTILASGSRDNTVQLWSLPETAALQ